MFLSSSNLQLLDVLIYYRQLYFFGLALYDSFMYWRASSFIVCSTPIFQCNEECLQFVCEDCEVDMEIFRFLYGLYFCVYSNRCFSILFGGLIVA